VIEATKNENPKSNSHNSPELKHSYF